MLRSFTFFCLSAILLMGLSLSAVAQSNALRESKIHVGGGVGLFTYYGPLSLTNPNLPDNSTVDSDAALVFYGSFPVKRNHMYFRTILGFANYINISNPTRISPEENMFITNTLLMFEPQAVFVLAPGRRQLMPYVYTGFGLMIADPLGRNEVANNPGSGAPGPERTVWTVPAGFGVDYLFEKSPIEGHEFSMFLDLSFRWHLNYVARDEANKQRQNSTMILGGVRIGLTNVKKKVRLPDSAPLPVPEDIPAYVSPPLQMPVQREPEVQYIEPMPQPMATGCGLSELNTVYFNYGETELSAETIERLEENIEMLYQYPGCWVLIDGYTDHMGSGNRVSDLRGQTVYDYYTSRGIDPARLILRDMGVASPPCDKEDPGQGCRMNRRVESTPIDQGQW